MHHLHFDAIHDTVWSKSIERKHCPGKKAIKRIEKIDERNVAKTRNRAMYGCTWSYYIQI